jgi:hypothetical protein
MFDFGFRICMHCCLFWFERDTKITLRQLILNGHISLTLFQCCHFDNSVILIFESSEVCPSSRQSVCQEITTTLETLFRSPT